MNRRNTPSILKQNQYPLSPRKKRQQQIENLRNGIGVLDKDTIERMLAAEAFLNRMKPSTFLLDSSLNFIWHHIGLDIINTSKDIGSIEELLSSLQIISNDKKNALAYIKGASMQQTKDYAIKITSADGRAFSINSVVRSDGKIQFTIKEESKIENFDQANSNHASKILFLIKRKKESIQKLIDIHEKGIPDFETDLKLWKKISQFRARIAEVSKLPLFYNQFTNIRNMPKNPPVDWASRLEYGRSLAGNNSLLTTGLRNKYANILDFFNNALPMFIFSPTGSVVYTLSGKNPKKYSSLLDFFSSQFSLSGTLGNSTINEIVKNLASPVIDQFIIKILTKTMSVACMNDIANLSNDKTGGFQATLTPYKWEGIHKMMTGNTVDNNLEQYLKEPILRGTDPTKKDLQKAISSFTNLIYSLESMVHQ